MGFVLFWICIQFWWYYKWMFIMSSIPYHEQPFFQELQSSTRTLNDFFIFVQRFMHAHPQDIFHMFFYTRIHNHFVQVWYMTRGIFWVEHYLFYHIFVLFALLQQHTLLVFPSFVNDMHIVGPISKHGTHIFTLTSGACNTRTFHSLNKMCSLLSIDIILIHITSNKLSYIQHMFSYSRCTNGFYAICGILCCRGVLEGF